MLWPFTKRKQPSASDAARILAAARGKADRQRIHAKADEMRRNAGLPPVQWPAS